MPNAWSGQTVSHAPAHEASGDSILGKSRSAGARKKQRSVMRQRLVGLLVLALSCCVTPAVLAAQSAIPLPTVQGTVLDSSGAPIAGAAVTIASENQAAG